MRFSVLLVFALAVQGCGIGNSPLAPNDCGGNWGGFSFGPSVSGFRLSTFSLGDMKVGDASEFSLLLDPPSVGYSCSSETHDKFSYLVWTWNATSSGPPLGEFGVLLPPVYGPIAVTIASCQCTFFGEPIWKAERSNIANGHWEQRAWLHASQTVRFSLRGTEPGSTRVTVFAYVNPPGAYGDVGPAAFGSVAIKVVP